MHTLNCYIQSYSGIALIIIVTINYYIEVINRL